MAEDPHDKERRVISRVYLQVAVFITVGAKSDQQGIYRIEAETLWG